MGQTVCRSGKLTQAHGAGDARSRRGLRHALPPGARLPGRVAAGRLDAGDTGVVAAAEALRQAVRRGALTLGPGRCTASGITMVGNKDGANRKGM
eukprot:gene6999-biopygen13531